RADNGHARHDPYLRSTSASVRQRIRSTTAVRGCQGNPGPRGPGYHIGAGGVDRESTTIDRQKGYIKIPTRSSFHHSHVRRATIGRQASITSHLPKHNPPVHELRGARFSRWLWSSL